MFSNFCHILRKFSNFALGFYTEQAIKYQDCIIVLHHTVFSDSAVMLHTLSRRYGRRSFLVRGAARSIHHFQPLNILECELSSSPKSDILAASSFREACPLAALRGSYGKNAVSMFLAELLFRTLEEDAPDEALFEWCRSRILLLDALEGDYANFHICFLLDYCAFLGFRPSYENLLPFSEVYALKIKELIDNPGESALLVPLCGAQRAAICEVMVRYLSAHLEKTVNIRSLEVLSQLF